MCYNLGLRGVADVAHGRWDLAAGQLVIVDEASLAGAATLDLLSAHAAHVGAKVLLAGDWAQLAAVDAGGAFGLLVRDRNNQADGDLAPELADIRRFTSEWEKTASLGLRRGDTDVIDLYDEHGRIIDAITTRCSMPPISRGRPTPLPAGRAS
jgi:hypothetical protein